MTLTHAIESQATCRIVLTMSEAQALPNLLGRIVPAMLRVHGFYTATVGDVKTLYILKTTESQQ